MTYNVGVPPFVQINFDYSRAPAYNIYRSTDLSTWNKIISDFPSNAHTAVDYNISADSNIYYYCIAALDKEGRETFRSLTGVISIK